MGRSRIWKVLRVIGLGLVGLMVALGLAVVVFLNTVGPKADFDFLSGRPVLESAVSGFDSQSRSSCDEFRVFSWRQPFGTLYPAVDRELSSKGYRLSRKGFGWAEWKCGTRSLSMSSSWVYGRPVLMHNKQDPFSVTVIVGNELEDDLMFHFRLIFSPYGISST